MVVEFTTTFAIGDYHHYSCEFESRLWRNVLDTTLCGKACQYICGISVFSLCTPVCSVNKTERHDITEVVLQVTLNTILVIVVAFFFIHIQLFIILQWLSKVVCRLFHTLLIQVHICF